MYGYGDAPGQVLVLNNNINNGVIGRSNTSYAGGFLGVNKFALVANNNVNNAEILSSSYAGGLVGRQDNSYVDAEINNGINNGNITGYGAVGGIVGYLAAKDFVLEDSYNTGDIEAIQYGGGIIGRGQDLSLTGTINEVYNTGDINCNNYCGGIIGVDYSTVTLKNSYNIGNITTNVSTTSIGGISGEGLYQIINTYNAGNITSIKDTRANNIGGITGMNTIANFKYENVVNAGTITSKYRSAGILSFGQLSYNGGTLNNVYSLGSVNVTSAEIYDDTKAYSLGCNLDGVNLVDVYILDGIAPYIARTMTSIDPYIISTSPSILSVVNGESKFKADSNNTNHGYPKLIWQE